MILSLGIDAVVQLMTLPNPGACWNGRSTEPRSGPPTRWEVIEWDNVCMWNVKQDINAINVLRVNVLMRFYGVNGLEMFHFLFRVA